MALLNVSSVKVGVFVSSFSPINQHLAHGRFSINIFGFINGWMNEQVKGPVGTRTPSNSDLLFFLRLLLPLGHSSMSLNSKLSESSFNK